MGNVKSTSLPGLSPRHKFVKRYKTDENHSTSPWESADELDDMPSSQQLLLPRTTAFSPTWQNSTQRQDPVEICIWCGLTTPDIGKSTPCASKPSAGRETCPGPLGSPGSTAVIVVTMGLALSSVFVLNPGLSSDPPLKAERLVSQMEIQPLNTNKQKS